MAKSLYIIMVLIFIITSIQDVRADSNICFNCHSHETKDFQKSIHSNILCTDCHGGDSTTTTTISTNAMNTQDFIVPNRTDIAELCSKCHIEAADQYEESIHSKELMMGAASCLDCHAGASVHDIQSTKNPEYSENISELCAGCHENQTKMSAWYYGIKTNRYDTYKHSYHYKAIISGGKGLATCPDCHENHNTRNESDPDSAIYPENLPATCGKPQCHPDAEDTKIYGGKIHEGQSVYLSIIDVKKLVTYFYIIMILFELSFTLGLILLDINSRYDIRRRHL